MEHSPAVCVVKIVAQSYTVRNKEKREVLMIVYEQWRFTAQASASCSFGPLANKTPEKGSSHAKIA